MDYAEVSKHNTASSCWVILYDQVYDVTSFLLSHPGGAKTILNLAGTDATSTYDPIHPPGTLESSLPASAHLGAIDKSTLPTPLTNTSPSTPSEKPAIPELSSLLNLTEIAKAAEPLLSPQALAYYSSASDDLRSKALNSDVYTRILLRPRIFVDCTSVSLQTTLLKHTRSPLSLQVPFFVSPAAMARLAHPSGERGIASACAGYGAMQIISNNASLTPEQITADAPPGQVFGWQLYVQTDRARSEAMLARIAKIPAIKCLVLTLDAPVPGKREADEKAKNVAADLPVRSAVQVAASATQSSTDASETSGGGGLGRALFAGTAADLTWSSTLSWLTQHTTLPIILKGVQTHEDAYLAMQHAPQVAGIILSNHGGRAADTAPPAIHTLLEIRRYCPEVLARIDVWVDGGITRGTDVVKALALGAKAVGLGRAPLYGLAVGGPQGVERVLQILKEEIETAMRLLGCKRIEQLGLKHVNARAVERDIYDGSAGLEKLGLWMQAKL